MEKLNGATLSLSKARRATAEAERSMQSWEKQGRGMAYLRDGVSKQCGAKERLLKAIRSEGMA